MFMNLYFLLERFNSQVIKIYHEYDFANATGVRLNW